MTTHKDGLYAVDLSHVEWRTSSYSNGGEQCVEFAQLPGNSVAVRDSKDTEREPLRYTAAGWDTFRKAVQDGAL